MKIRIEGEEFDIEESITKASISDLILLKRATKSRDFPGVSVKTIMESLQGVEDPMDFLDTEETMECLRGIIFLCRRKAGDMRSIDELTAFPLFDIAFIDEDDDEEEATEEDPKALDGGRVEELAE